MMKRKKAVIIVDANLVLDDSGKLLPIVNAASDASYMKESTLHFQISHNLEDMTNRVQLTSKGGTISKYVQLKIRARLHNIFSING